MPNYLALTLGPIHKTITQQRSTRAVFSASYLFSYTMRELLRKLIDLDGGFAERILAPSVQGLDQTATRCGRYGDRLIIRAEDGEREYAQLLDAGQRVLEHLADKLEDASQQFKKGETLPYLQRYLQLYSLHLELPEGEQTITKINAALDQLELFPAFPAGTTEERQPLPDEDHLLRFFSSLQQHFIIEDAFGADQKRFPSLVEIATSGLSRLDGYKKLVTQKVRRQHIDEEADIYQSLHQSEVFRPHLRAYHKYVAIVCADADSLGQYTESISQSGMQPYRELSDQMARFGLAARDAIEAYGGSPVYIGGDDLLFFAPVAAPPSEEQPLATLFDLIKKLDGLFQQHVHSEVPGVKAPTLSYGLSISYHKYPMNEALETAYELLADAKGQPDKNSIAFRLLKHSGQHFGMVLLKQEPTQEQPQPLYAVFQSLMRYTDVEADFINSLAHSIGFFEGFFETLVDDENAIQNLFDNNLDEATHDQQRGFIREVARYVRLAYQHCRAVNTAQPGLYQRSPGAMHRAALSIVYSTLRFVHFVRSQPERL